MSTTLLCAADLHVGAAAAHRRDPLADQEAILDQIADLARGCDGVLLAGDIFHRPKPTLAELHLFARFVRQLSVPAVAVVGNTGHDLTNGDEPTALELFDDLRRFFVSRVPEVVMVAGVAVCTLPSTPVHRLVAQGDTDRGPVNELAADLLIRAAADLRAQVSAGMPAVLLGHWAVSGASLPNGLPAEELREPVLDTLALSGQGWDAIVLGHLHRPDMVNTAPPTFYCGSPMTMDFGEAGFEHGVWILTLTEPGAGGVEGTSVRTGSKAEQSASVSSVARDVDRLAMATTGQEVGLAAPGSVSVEFVPLADRAFVTVEADLTDPVDEFSGADETDQIAAAIPEVSLTDAVVRVTYRATEEQHRRVDQDVIRRLLADARVHRVTQIAWEPVRQTRARVQGVDETVGLDEAVRAWCAANRCEERADALIEWAAA